MLHLTYIFQFYLNLGRNYEFGQNYEKFGQN
jgi:hypothetical protein